MNLLQRLQEALKEDIGTGDITSLALIEEGKRDQAELLAKKEGILCGLNVAMDTFRLLDPQSEFEFFLPDGAKLTPGKVIMRMFALTRAILGAERVALNLLCHLSGIATLTNHYVQLIEGTGARVLDTRKTMPLWRDLEKYAVQVGGGTNHRFGLYDMILIKDNHIQAVGGVTQAIRRARAASPLGMKLEIEVTSISQFLEALEEKPDWIMLDNMDLAQMRDCVQVGKGKVIIEASGGITESNIRQVALTGVDFISVGRLTHSAPALDISLELGEN